MTDLVWIFDSKPMTATRKAEWPMAMYQGPLRKHAAYILCEDEFTELKCKLGNHRPLAVLLLHYGVSEPPNPRRMLSNFRFPNFRIATEFTQTFLNKNPEWIPKII